MSKPDVRRRPKAVVSSRTSSSPPRRSGKKWALVGFAAVVASLIAVAIFTLTGGKTTADPAVAAVARGNAGGDVRVITGSHHTVYHSTAALPSASAPREDGKPTLVWFSGTWCEYCAKMDAYAPHQIASRYADRSVFVEKSVDDDRAAAAHYGVRGTPTFVLIDAHGKELARFGFQSTAAAFTQTIEAALVRAKTGS